MCSIYFILLVSICFTFLFFKPIKRFHVCKLVFLNLTKNKLVSSCFYNPTSKFYFNSKDYPFTQGMPSAMPKTFASFIMHENSDPIFLRSEVTFCKFLSSWVTYLHKPNEVSMKILFFLFSFFSFLKKGPK